MYFLEVGDLRLVEGSATSGGIEIFLNGTWRSICSDNWDSRDSTVVCRQLGFKGVLATLSNATESSDTILMSDVDCFGSEASLLDCHYTTTHNCNLLENVWIFCHPHGK